MPRSYPPEAIEKCQTLYLRHNGQSHDRIEKEMRRTYPGWSKQNLYSRGDKIGWIEKYGWDQALKEKIALASGNQAKTAEESLFIEIEQIRKRLHHKVHVEGCSDRDVVYQHLAYCRLGIEALAKLKGAGNTFESFVAFWEWLLDLLPDISDRAARELLTVADEVLEKARSKYGEQEEADAGTADF